MQVVNGEQSPSQSVEGNNDQNQSQNSSALALASTSSSSSSSSSTVPPATTATATTTTATATTQQQKQSQQQRKPRKKRKMDLQWCSRDYCKDVVRERVVGDHNQIILNGPATGQVAYSWSGYSEQTEQQQQLPPPPASSAHQSNDPPRRRTHHPSGSQLYHFSSQQQQQHQQNHGKASTSDASVLLLVRPNDEDLMRIAAKAVKQLTQFEIEVLLVPDLAAKLKYYYGVDDERIRLFEPEMGPDLGERHANDDEEDWEDSLMTDGFTPFPDLVCTVGGDGLLMHASMMFQGPVPPIISIAGGSLGFLTPFSTDEMVDAIRIALGVVKDGSSSASSNQTETLSSSDSRELEVFPPNMHSYPYEPLVKPPHTLGSKPKFSFGVGNTICLSIRMRLDCRVVSREGAVRARFNVLNEVVIDRGSSPYLAALECFCDDVHITTVQADGVIFAT